MTYKIYVRDQYLNRIAEIDDYQSLDMVLRFNNPGSWALTLPTNSFASREILKYQSGIVVVRDGVTIFSGPVKGRKRKWNADEDTLEFWGSDDTAWLERRLAYADPNVNPSGVKTNFFPFFPMRLVSEKAPTYDTRKGPAETVMRQFVDYNAGANALPERRVPGLILAEDQGRGKTVTGKTRYNSLFELTNSLALAGGDLGFRIVQTGKNLEFQVYDPADKTATAIFSPLLGNLRDFEYSSEDSETNYVIAGGDGVGASRIFEEDGNSTSIAKYGRFESFLDETSTAEIDELQQAIDGELAEKSEKVSLSISPIDTEQLAFGRDYGLGDKVSVVITYPNEVVSAEDIYRLISSRSIQTQQKLDVIQDVVREVKISLTPDGERITPTIGTPESTSKSVLKIFRDMKNIKKQISKQERR